VRLTTGSAFGRPALATESSSNAAAALVRPPKPASALALAAAHEALRSMPSPGALKVSGPASAV
jgi:hypothetical protein